MQFSVLLMLPFDGYSHDPSVLVVALYSNRTLTSRFVSSLLLNFSFALGDTIIVYHYLCTCHMGLRLN